MWNIPFRLFTGTFSPDLRQQRLARAFWAVLVALGVYAYLFSLAVEHAGEEHLFRLLAFWILAPVVTGGVLFWRWWRKSVRPQLDRLEQLGAVEEPEPQMDDEDWAED